MEPLAVQSSTGLIRPTIDLQSDLAAVLREGRVLAGEVLQTLDGGTLLIGVGSHRVPAQAPSQLEVRLRPGQRFLFQAHAEGDGWVLSVLGEPGALEPRLLRALRSAAGGSGALGQLLGELVSALGMEVPGPGPEAAGAGARALRAGFAGRAFPPGGGGAALARTLAQGGLGHEARLSEAALASFGAGRLEALGRELAGLLTAELVQAAPLTVAGDFERELRLALLRSREAGGGRQGPRALLRSALASLAPDEPTRARLLGRLDRALPAGLGAGLEDVLLGALLGKEAWLGGRAGPAPQAESLLAEARLDLKGQLLRALAELPDGPARTAAARALEGLEREQLLNLARARSGDALHFALPVLDGERWTTAHLFFRPRGREGGGARGELEGLQRITVAVDFLHTGPVRAELAVSPGSLAGRVAVARPEVLERMAAEGAELETRLALGGRRVSLAFVLAEAEKLGVERELFDIRFLREHRLLDRSA